MRYSLQIVSRVVHYHQDVFMSSGQLWQRPHEIHTHPLKWDHINWQWDEGAPFEWVGVSHVHDGVDLGLKHDVETTGLLVA